MSAQLRRPLLLASLLLLPSARAAESLGVVAVAEPPGPGARLSALTGEFQATLGARTAGVLDGETMRDRMTGRSPPAALAELDRAFAGAVAAHAAGEYEAATRTLRSVVDSLEALPEGPEVFAAWKRALLRLARSEQELGRGVTAQATLERLLRAAPEERADPRLYPPSFQGLLEEARGRLRALGARRLTVESQPAARIFVEGREVGTSPVALELAPGRYRVAGIAGGVRAPAQIVELSEDRHLQLDLSLAEALRPEAGPGLALPAADRTARLIAAGSRLGLDRVAAVELAGAIGGGAGGDAGGRTIAFLSATLLDVRRVAVVREGRIALASASATPAALAALAAYLVDGEPSPLVATPGGPSLTLAPPLPTGSAPQGTPAPPRRGSALGWAAVGSGAAALVAGALTAVHVRDAQGKYADARAMLDGSGRVAPPGTVAQYNAAIRSGDGARGRAVASGIATGATLATAAVLGWLSWRQTGEVGPFRF